MGFEEYQFLRYYIPGSLYIIYIGVLTVSILNPVLINFFKNDTSALLGLVGGAFGASLAIGYIIYTFYDTFLYSKWAMDFKNRESLRYLAKKIEGWDDPNEPGNKNNIEEHNKKMFLDMLWISFDKDTLSERYDKTLRGMWSHLNARKVCYLVVPAFSLFSVFLLAIIALLIGKSLFSFQATNLLLFAIVVGIVAGISEVLREGAKRPLEEVTTLEYFFIKNRIEKNQDDFDEMVERLLNRKITECQSGRHS